MIRAMIIDDEQLSVDKLYKLLRESGKVDIRGEYTDASEALTALKGEHVDAVFLDTDMPMYNSFEIASAILETQGNVTVSFCCSHEQADEGLFFRHQLDCLTKPIKKEKLGETLDKIICEKTNVSKTLNTLTVYCFGRFKVFAGDTQLAFSTEKAEELFAYLVGNYGRSIHKNEIIGNLWGDCTGELEEIFHITLFSIKKLFLQYGISMRVEYNEGYCKLEIDRLLCDYCNFKLFISEPLEMNEHTIRDFDEMIALYTADYLFESGYPWAMRKRKFIREKYIELSLHVFEYYTSNGETSRALEAIRAGLRVEPLDRELNFQLMKAYKNIHEIVALYKHFERYKRELKAQSGIEPDNGIKKLL